jgi:nicotinamidase-related amidase
MEYPSVGTRHPSILRAESTILLVVDIQERLVPAIDQGQRVIAETVRLIEGCRVLDIPVVGTEQYPKGLGPLVPEVRNLINPKTIFSKMAFSICRVEEVMHLLRERGRNQVVLAGIEAHVCMLQTSLDLVEHGYQVHVPVETTSSRRSTCCHVALMRMREAGVVVTMLESALFEMLGLAGTSQFKEILDLVK